MEKVRNFHSVVSSYYCCNVNLAVQKLTQAGNNLTRSVLFYLLENNDQSSLHFFATQKQSIAKLPVVLVCLATVTAPSEAIKKEHQIKKWSRKKKEDLINGDEKGLSGMAKKQFK